MKYLVFILAIVIAISSCNKTGPINNELHCPPYDPTILNTWFPYEKGATYYYKDSTGDEHWLAIENVRYVNGDEPSEGWDCTAETECIPAGSVFAYRDREREDKIWFHALHSPNHRSITLSWNSYNADILVNEDGSLSLDPLFYDRPEEYYKTYKPGFVHHSQLYLNEVSYTDVYEITFNNNNMGNARTVYLAKNKGIVGYETKAGRSYWIEQ